MIFLIGGLDSIFFQDLTLFYTLEKGKNAPFRNSLLASLLLHIDLTLSQIYLQINSESLKLLSV